MRVQPAIDTLAAYVPYRLARRLDAAHGSQQVAATDHFLTACLFADLSGFTQLSAALAAEGAAGAEKLSSILDRCLGRLIDCIYGSGGDVMHFAGDAVIAVWPAIDPSDLPSQVHRALACAARSQRALDGWVAHPGHAMRLRIGVGAGPAVLIDLGVGTTKRRWVAAGSALKQVALAERMATPGTTVLSPQAAALLPLPREAERLPGGGARLDRSCRSAILASAPDSTESRPPQSQGDRLERALRAYVPGAVLSRLDAGHTEWMAELRTVTAVFAHYPTLDPSTPAQQQLTRELVDQAWSILDRLGGSLDNLLVDDHGTTLVLAFGMPPAAHPDDAVRAVLAALELSEQAEQEELCCSVGIATGRAFCGTYGNALRRDYTFLGDVVNLASRLMLQADGRVLCDAETTRSVAERIDLMPVGTLSVRGRDAPEAVTQAVGRHGIAARYHSLITRQSDQGSPADGLAPGHLVGRDPQLRSLLDCVAAVARGEQRVALLRSAPGMGRSLLLASLREIVRARGHSCFIGVAEPLYRSVPYFAFRDPLALTLGIHKASRPQARARLGDLLPQTGPLRGWLPLLDSVFGTDEAEDTNGTVALDSTERAAATRELLVALLRARCRQGPVVLLVDDCQWLDPSSWQLVNSMIGLPGLMLVVAIQTVRDEPPATIAPLLAAPGSVIVDLPGLAATDIAELARRLLGVEHLSDELEHLLVSHAAGSPFFCAELITTLQQSSGVVVRDNRAQLSPRARSGELALPPTVQRAITGRVDRLPESEQLTLKVAAVVGPTLTAPDLAAAHPVEHDPARLEAQLAHLVEAGLLARHEETGAYAFRHRVVWECCYRLLVPGKRRRLHAAVAGWLETQDLVPRPHTRLAHHHRRAGDLRRALDHLHAAGLAALELGADTEAVLALTDALALARKLGPTSPISRTHQADLMRGLGVALHGRGDFEAAAESLRGALALLGEPLPTSPTGWAGRLVLEGGRQAVNRLFPGLLRWLARRGRSEPLVAASHAASWYADVSYFRVDPLPWLVAGLISANYAERAGDIGIAGPAFVNLANIFGTLHLRALERVYMRLASASPDVRVELMGCWSVAVVEIARCDWPAATASVARGLDRGRAVGDRWALVNGLNIHGLIGYHTGALAECLPRFAEARQIASSMDRPAQQAYGSIFVVPALLAMGRYEDAGLLLSRSQSQRPRMDHVSQVAWHGVRAGLHLRQGRLEDGVEEAARSLGLFSDKPLPVFTYAGPLALVLEVLLAAEARGGTVGGRSSSELAALRKQAHQAITKGARFFRHFRPRLCMLRGTACWQAGRRGRALRAWRRGLVLADRFAMPGDAGRIHVEIARHADRSSAQYSTHQAAAGETLGPLGAAGDLALLV